MILKTSSPDRPNNVRLQWGILLCAVPLTLGLTAASPIGAATVRVDCNTGGAVGRILSGLTTGDVVLVQGTCQENILLQAQLQHITLDGQHKATIKAPDPSQPAIQILGREITLKGFTIIGGSFGVAADETIVSLCPHRFREAGTVFDWVGRELLSCAKPTVIREVPFLLGNAGLPDDDPDAVGQIDVDLSTGVVTYAD